MLSRTIRILQSAPRVGVLRSFITWSTKRLIKKHAHRLPRDFHLGAEWLLIKSRTGNFHYEGRPSFRVSTTSVWFASRLVGVSLAIDGKRYPLEELVLLAGKDAYKADKIHNLPLAAGRTYSVVVPGLTLPDGVHFINLKLKTDLQDFDYFGLPILLENGQGGAPSLKKIESSIKEGDEFTVHYVPHIHYDVEWIFNRERFMAVGFRNLLDAVGLMERDPEHTFVLDQGPHIQPFLERFPEEGARLRKWADEGRLELVNGLWAEPDVNMVGGESLVRSSIMWQRFAVEHFGRLSKVGWFIDAFGQSAQIPQILAKSGTPCFAFSRVIEDDNHPTEFWWEGLDGSRVLTHHMKYMYNVGYPIMEERELSEARLKFTIGALAPHRTSDHIFYPAGVDHGRPLGFAQKGIRDWNEKHPSIPIKKSAPSRFFATIDRNRLSVVKGEFQRELWGVYSSRIKGKIQNRRVELKALHAETWAAIASLYGFEYPARTLEEQWKEMLADQFHDCICGCSSDDVMEGMEHRLYSVEKNLDRIRNEAQRHIASRIAQSNASIKPRFADNGESSKISDVSPIPVVAFNPLSWPRSAWVEAVIHLPRGVAEAELVDDKGQPVATQELDRHLYLDGNTLELKIGWVATFPALGWRTFYVAPSPVVAPRDHEPVGHGRLAEKYRLANQLVAVHIDPTTGLVRTLEDRSADKQYKFLTGNQLTLQRDMGTLYNPIIIGKGRRSGKRGSVDVSLVESGPIRSTARIKGRIAGNDYTQYITVTEGVPRVDFKTDVNMGTPHRRLRVGFPAPFKGTWRHGVPYGFIERPAHELPARDWADLSGPEGGVTLIQFGTPGMSLEKGRMTISLWRSTNLIHFIPAGKGAFSLGEHSFRYALAPHGPFDEALPRRYARERNEPPVAIRSHGIGGDLPPERSMINIDSDNLTVEALYREKDCIIVRILECRGKSGRARVKLGFDAASAVLTDLIGNEEQRVPIKSAGFEIDYKAFQIITLRLQTG